jgi:uncharacterized protein (DUF1015 family)
MAQVSGFRGIRYQPAVVQLETVLAPPYDVISQDLQVELYGRAMQNVVRLELGRQYPNDVPGRQDRYTRARDHLRAWLAEGVLVQDDTPSVYIYRHSFRPPGGGGPRERLGCFVGVQPVPYDRREVLRHELTLTAPREDRMRLLQAMKAQTSPVFLLYEDSAEVTSELERAASASPTVAEAVTMGESGKERHQLWHLSEPTAVRLITEGLSQTRLFIADGHHRYETALTLGLPQVLALVSPLDDPGNVILPTHRVVPEAPLGVEELRGPLAAAGWKVESAVELSEVMARIEALRATDHAFGIAGSAGKLVAHRPRGEGRSQSPRSGLDVAVLESEILDPLMGIASGEAAAGRLVYTRDPQEALEVALARNGVAFLVNPTTVSEMAEVALADEAMPQKSTHFFPKVPAGLVIMGSE